MTSERVKDREEEPKTDDSDTETESSYHDLRAKLRALQREVALASSKLDSAVQEKEDIIVQLGHAKRDRAKVAADAEATSLERDALERENKRIKARLEVASKELKELGDERRKLSEKLTVQEGTHLFFDFRSHAMLLGNRQNVQLVCGHPSSSRLPSVRPTHSSLPVILFDSCIYT